MFKIDILTLFPELFEPFFKKGLIGQAVGHQLKYRLVNPRDYTVDAHRTVDDRPYGGGDGMVMLAEPLEKALGACDRTDRQVIYLSPQGEGLTDSLAHELSLSQGVILICGRYGGIDERFIATNVDREISIGDYVLSGGEVGAMAVIEAVSRFLPGVLGNEKSAQHDSFRNGLLEAPQMTRPPEYQGMRVPAVLTSGHHKQIEEWRHKIAILRTYFRRPDLAGGIPREQIQKAMALYDSMSESERRACGLPLRLP